jgi:hypothetical protein
MFKNTFIGGMNSDNSPDKVPNNKYYRMENGLIITESGLSTGAATNELGNELRFSIPDTEAIYSITIPNGYTGPSQIIINSLVINVLSTDTAGIKAELEAALVTSISNGDLIIQSTPAYIYIIGLNSTLTVTLNSGGLNLTTLVSPQTDLEIAGWGRLENYIILLTTNIIDDNAVNTPGQIWMFEFDEENKQVIGVINNALVPSVHLKYNHNMGISLTHRIGEVIGRYENSKTGRVFWTDDYNPLRTVNIFQSIWTILPDNLSITANASMSKPYITEVSTGSIPAPSTVQYGYRLSTIGGQQTIFSPTSELVQITPFDPQSETYSDYTGGTGLGGSVTYTLDNLDTTYDLIEHIVILYQQKDVPLIYKFAEQFVPSSGSITVKHNGDEDYIEISTQEFNALQGAFSRCKSITQKRNRLIVSNVDTEKFELDFDARAYRYNNAGTCLLLDSAGSSTTFNGTSFPSDETLDAICPFSISPDNPLYNNAYEYQADGITIGGQGPRVSYQFTVNQHLATNTYGNFSTVPFVNSPRPFNANITVDGKTIDISNYFQDNKSPLQSAYFTGYASGEVYRFGVVFYDLKGNPSFVKWIGDIRFPERFDNPAYSLINRVGNTVFCNSLGIEFTIDISSIQDRITGYSFVRVERTSADKTRLGTGVHIALSDAGTNNGSGLTRLATAHTEVYGTTMEVGGANVTNPIVITDARTLASSFEPFAAQSCFFLSPLSQFPTAVTGYNYRSGDYLKTIGYLEVKQQVGTPHTSTTPGFIDLAHTQHNPINPDQDYLIQAQETLEQGTYTDTPIFGSGNKVFNTSVTIEGLGVGASSRHVPLGIGNRKQLIRFDLAPTDPFYDPYNIAGFDYPGNVLTESQTPYFRTYAYCRLQNNQYGGNSYEARSNQSYIACNFIRVNNQSNPIQTHEIFSGDTYTLLYSDEIISQYWGTASLQGFPYKDSPPAYKLGWAMIFPVEVSFNTKLRQGQFWEQDRDYSNAGAFLLNEYLLDTVYSQENTAKRQFLTKDFIDNTVEERPHRIWASETKLDGELYDSWRIFKPNNFIEVDGVYGEINKVITHRDKLYFVQARAVGIASIEDRSIVNDETGAQIVLGSGQVLDHYAYITTRTGTLHQFSVVESGTSLYWVDSLLRKIFRYTEGSGAAPLTDIQGISGELQSIIDGNIVDTDSTIRIQPPANNYLGKARVGIHGEYDPRRNRVFFTFLNGFYFQGTQLIRDGDATFYNYNWTAQENTVSFNENQNAFDSWFSFAPSLYINTNNRLITVDPETGDTGWVHNEGTRGSYYGTIHDWKLKLIINGQTDLVKVLDVIEYLMELKDTSNQDLSNETLTSIRISNSYQDTNSITLVPNSNIIRRLRSWRLNTIRAAAVTDRPRMRDYYFMVELTFTNNQNKQMVLHDLTSFMRGSQF